MLLTSSQYSEGVTAHANANAHADDPGPAYGSIISITTIRSVTQRSRHQRASASGVHINVQTNKQTTTARSSFGWFCLVLVSDSRRHSYCVLLMKDESLPQAATWTHLGSNHTLRVSPANVKQKQTNKQIHTHFNLTLKRNNTPRYRQSDRWKNKQANK